MSVRSTSPIMRSSPVQVIPMEEPNDFKRGGLGKDDDHGQPRAWTPPAAKGDSKLLNF